MAGASAQPARGPRPRISPFSAISFLAVAVFVSLIVITGISNTFNLLLINPLINALIIQPIRDLNHRLNWSDWRRRHQARARRAHYTRRLTLELQP